MRKEDKMNVNGIQIMVKELTVAEVRHWMMDMMHKESSEDDSGVIDNVMDQGLFEDIGISDILRMTDLSTDLINDLTPSQLRLVVDRCKVLNPDFFGMRKRVFSLASGRA